MALALDLARRARGWTAPNPAVGAVIVLDGRIVGEGFTQPVGSHHAEVMALADARKRGFDPRGSTVYVTLEPCCHHGRTPPCTDALIEAGVSRVVAGVVDPWPAVHGGGLAALRAAGIEVDVGDAAEECGRQILGFQRALSAGLPEVTCKVATSLDGRIATANGESRWITSEEARVDGHLLRASHDAIAVGMGTVLADDPSLTTRLPPDAIAGRTPTHPVPVVFDTELQISADAAVFRHPRRPVVCCAIDAPARELPGDVVRVPRSPAGLDLGAALSALAARGLHRVLVEGGGRVHRSLLDDRLVDQVVAYIAPTVIPGGIPWVAGPAVAALADATRGRLVDVARVGADVRLEVRFRHRAEG
jgi:diaminohydroxyphosphoribosylaminopyrimidine deaminase/5-amino-6-(5-phosphoribosylamino)uracil reductase